MDQMRLENFVEIVREISGPRYQEKKKRTQTLKLMLYVAHAKMQPEKDMPMLLVVFVPLIKKKKYSITYTFIFGGYFL